MKRFYLQRNIDASGVSGTGNVAEGCQFDNGWCALVWIVSQQDSDEVHAYYRSIERLEEIHGHDGATRVIWVDGESSNFVVTRQERRTGPTIKKKTNERRRTNGEPIA
jgi:hypothetical protein